jgi:hypothetical protein
MWEQLKGITDGSTERNINRLGDKVSIAILKMFGERELQDPQRIRNILPIIRKAFTYPKLISVAEDRKPKVTLFFLSRLQTDTKDAGLKKDISQLIDFIKQKTEAVDSK